MEAKELVKQFSNISFKWVPREYNEKADELSKRGMIAAGCQFKIQPIK
jgi:ribonuclease HI